MRLRLAKIRLPMKQLGSLSAKKRREQWVRMVLPLRVPANRGSEVFRGELAHTLEISSRGARIGTIRNPLEIGTKLIIQYHQRRIESRVLSIKRLDGTTEYQVEIDLLVGAANIWGLDLDKAKSVEEPDAKVVMVWETEK